MNTHDLFRKSTVIRRPKLSFRVFDQLKNKKFILKFLDVFRLLRYRCRCSIEKLSWNFSESSKEICRLKGLQIFYKWTPTWLVLCVFSAYFQKSFFARYPLMADFGNVFSPQTLLIFYPQNIKSAINYKKHLTEVWKDDQVWDLFKLMQII